VKIPNYRHFNTDKVTSKVSNCRAEYINQIINRAQKYISTITSPYLSMPLIQILVFSMAAEWKE
jgi:hypothetical protein